MVRRKRSSYIVISSLLSGILLWSCWPERGFTPFIFIAWVPLLFAEHTYSSVLRKTSGWIMFGNFYIALFTWNILTTWWIYNSTDIGSLVAIGLNSLFMTFIWQLFFIVKRKHGPAIGYSALILFWIAFEYLHLNWEISWPWLTLGNVFASKPEWIQWYEYTGVLGGSLWILLINIFIFQLIKNIRYQDLLLKLRKINILIISGAILLLVAAPLIFSIDLYYDHVDEGENINVVVLQPNIDPYNEKFNGTGQQQLVRLIRLAASTVDSATDFCFAPETALPDGIHEEQLEQDRSVKMIRSFIEAYPKLNFVTGLTSFKTYHEGESRPVTARQYKGSNDYYDVFNSAMLLTNVQSPQIYHKSKLVPGVEKMPYPAIFGFLEEYSIKLGGTSGSLGTQDHRTNFISNDETRFAPAICYESIYGDFMSGYIRDTAQFISIITNDGWWGDSPGFRQHMNYARLRSVEFRKSVARSANNGISCFINQRGDILQQSPWWTETALKQTIKKNKIITFYARHGDYIGFVCSFLSVTFLIYFIMRRMIRWF